MSDLIVEATRVKDIQKHPNADKLDVAIIKGWSVVVGKNQFKKGDSVIFVPPDALVPQALAQAWGVWKYLATRKDTTIGRVKCVKLRQQTSYGFVVANTENYPEGKDLKELLGITKWEPPEPKIHVGDADKEHPLFGSYTSIQNIRNFPDIFIEGEIVKLSEKLHGCNAAVSLVFTPEEDSWYKKSLDLIKSFFGITNPLRTENGLYSFMIRSHNKRRKLGTKSLYETPLTEKMKQTLISLRDTFSPTQNVTSVVIFGEIFGGKIQDLKYGNLDKTDFRMFEIEINKKYIDAEQVESISEKTEIPMVPVLYTGPYSDEIIQKYTTGNTTLMKDNPHMREGVIIRPIKERFHPKIGRVILKSVSDVYIRRHDGTEYH